MKPKFNIKLKLNDQDHVVLSDAVKDGGNVSKIKVRIEATHSGIVNKNNFFYIPKGMKNGAQSFVKPFPKPVLIAHDRDQDAIGRVIKSKYVDYPEYTVDIKDSNNPEDLVDQIVDFTKTRDFKKKGYKGLGHVELIVEITDQDAIEKILDKRYLTVSIGGDTDKAVCSICGVDKKNQDNVEDKCNHWRGEVYDGETAFLIAGDMTFDEVSYVNTPADTNAVSEVIKDSVDGSFQDAALEQDFRILDFEVQDTGDNKLKLADLFGNKKIVAETLALLGLNDFILDEERSKKLRKTSFLFAEERALPVNDKAHILAASNILDQLDDSEDVTAAKELLDGKFSRAFGKDTSFEDALAALKPNTEDKNELNDNQDVDKAGTVDIDYDTLADKVVEKLKSTVSLDDSFAGQRADALEIEVEALEAENNKLTDNLKKVIIDQILSREDKLQDSDYRKVLESRGIESLTDKLDDLIGHDYNSNEDNTAGVEDNANDDTSLEDNAEEGSITDTNINIDDASDNDGQVEDNQDESDDKGLEDDANDDTEVLSIEDVQKEYRNIFQNKGPAKASKYLRELADNKKLPENFSFAK